MKKISVTSREAVCAYCYLKFDHIACDVLIIANDDAPEPNEFSAMMSVREFLHTSGGKAVAIIAIILCIAAAGWSIWSNVGQDSAVKDANALLFMDIENGKTFTLNPTVGMSYPVKSPYTGHMTGYNCELCGWTKDGHVRSAPFPVVLNSELGKPGPTFCPDCGRLVVPHNPPAVEGHRPPPTEQEYLLSHKNP